MALILAWIAAALFIGLAAPSVAAATPVVTGVSPNNGRAECCSEIVVTGSGFLDATEVDFGPGNPAENFYVISDTEIDVVTASGPVGTTTDVTVTSPEGTSATSTADLYTFVDQPQLTSVSPPSGPENTNTTVVITGSNFVGVSDVVPAQSFTVNSPTQITAVMPKLASPSTSQIQVTNGAGTSPQTNVTFAVTGPPVVTKVNPSNGAGGQNVTISGVGITGITAVSFGGVPASSFSTGTGSSMTAVAPSGTGVVDVTITNSFGTSTVSTADEFSYLGPLPIVTSISPNSAVNSGGASIGVTGSHFTGATTVTFGSVAATSFTVNSDTSITAIAPAESVGTVDVQVTTPDGTSAKVSGDKLTFFAASSPPTVSSISPTTVAAGGQTTQVVITGTNLLAVTSVRFGSVTAPYLGGNQTGTLAIVNAPPGLAPGSYDVTVTTPVGTSTTTSGDVFTVSPAVPTVAQINPSTGPTNGGTTVQINGSGLTGATAVKFGGVNASFTVTDDFDVTAVSPPGTGAVDVNVTTPAGTTLSSSHSVFTYGTPPTVTSISPSSGSASGGATVTISGTGFSTLQSVAFGAQGAQIQSWTETQIVVVSPAGSGTVDVTVFNAFGQSAALAADKFTYSGSPPPTLTTISPSAGPTAGGTSVTITGTNFTNATAVKFGTTAATSFTVNNATTITATAPAGAAGAVDITVTTPGGTTATSQADKFLYAAPPVVTGVAPTKGSTAGGYAVTITGSNFYGAAVTAVKFGGVASTNFAVNSDNQITATAPASATATVDITVTDAGGTSATSSADRFQYFTPVVPTITAVTPNGGPTAGGTPITITGTGFTGATQVQATGNVIFTVVSDTQITTTTTPANAGPFDVNVTTDAGTSAKSPGDVFTFYAGPAVQGVSPNTGSTAGGATVVITGNNLTGASAVKFGATAATSFTVNNIGQITAVAPAGSVGTVDITVTTPGGVSTVTQSDQFSYISTPAPTVTSVNPTSGPGAGGTSVTITGTNFTQVTAVKFGSTTATAWTVNSATSITAVSPLGVVGAVDVTVTTPAGISTISSADQFTYTNSRPAPAISSVSPSQGPTIGGTSVTINGANFTGATSVKFGSTPAVGFSINNDSSITAGSPAGTAGVVDITVTSPGGTNAASASDHFTYFVNVPTVTSVSPSTGPTNGDTAVTLVGSGFTGATAVKFGGVPATAFSVANDGVINAASPAGAAGVVDVTVTAPGGASATSAADQFTYSGTTLPVVTGISPATGPTGGGTAVTITGSNLGPFLQSVMFGATASTSLIATSNTSVTAIAPPGTGTVDITITTNIGTSATGAADKFTYSGSGSVPVVSQLIPSGGPAAGGTVVTVNGAGFTGATAVKFGTTAATSFTVNTDTSLIATAPAGTGVVDVTVTTPSGTSLAQDGDKYTYGGPTITSISPTSGPTSGGTTVLVNGSGFTNAKSVTFGTTAAIGLVVFTDNQFQVTSPAGTAGVVDIIVTGAGGSSLATAADKFTYAGSGGPVITAISPTGGSPVGGTSVTVTGSGFTGATAVTFGTKAATTFTVISDTQVTATSPSGSGVVDITITSPAGTSAAVAADKFTYGAVPTVTRVNPATGPSTGGTSVTITGSGFTGATAVTFGGIAAQSFSVTNATSITAVSPAGSGTVDVQVTTPVATSVARTLDHFTYTGAASPPTVSSINPTSGSTAGGTSVIITGTNFTGVTSVKFGAASATFTVNSATSITATAPAGTVGTVDITVATSAGTSATSSADQFTYAAPPPAPAVTAINPTSGSTAGGTSVTITGTNFSGATSVKFGAATASFTVNGATSITATSPAGSAGAVDVTITTSAGTSATSAADQFTYQAQASPPTVTAINPTSGSTAGGTSVTITGANFTNATAVKFGAVSASFTVNSATSITATSPAGPAGVVDITITTSGGTSATSTADQFTYVSSPPPAPTVTSLNPSSGPVNGATSLTITGTNFSGVTQVMFGNAASPSFVVNSATSITAMTPFVATPGTVDVTVATSAGTSATSSADKFTYTAVAPTISTVSPSSGPTAGGTSVIITGANLTAATTVKFGAASAAFTVNADSQITATAPTGAAGTIDITVTTPSGTNATSAADHFTYTSSGAAPAITAIAPTGGSPIGGTSVTITGSGFTGATAVTFGTKAATTFHVVSDTQVTATSPSGSGVADITITSPSGTSAVVAADKFTYGAVPAVTRVNPATGPSTGGTPVTITGSGFTGATTVTFGGVAAQSFSVTNATSVTAVSPAGSGTVDVQVTTQVGTSVARTLDHFAYTGAASPPTVTSVNPTSGSTSGGTSVTITGTNFTGATGVKFGTASATFTVNSATSITATSPVGSAGTVDIVVTTSAGASATSSADHFNYQAQATPTVSGVSPASGPTSGGTSVAVTGTNFTGATTVKFGSATATFTVNSATSITATSPAGSAGAVDITVTTSAGVSTASAADQFTYTVAASPPTVTAVSPNSTPIDTQTTITITGTNFTSATQVRFGSVNASDFVVNSATSITATNAFASTGGTVDVTVTTPAGTSATNAADQFTFTVPPAPTVTAISPTSGSANGGTVVTVTGSGFDSTISVKFGSVTVSTFNVTSDTSMTLTSPAGAAGVVDITVVGSGGASATSAADRFTYLAAPPTVTGLGPSSGPATGGTSVIVSGTGFTGATQVKFGATAAPTFVVNSDTQITATTPAESAGAVPVTVTTPAGTSPVGSEQFTFTASGSGPSITAISPTGGSPVGGTSVTITGSGFTGATAVKFGTKAATTFTVVSDTQVTATSPSGSGVVDIAIATPNGTTAAIAADKFTYGAVPAVTRVNPATGPSTGGTSVTVTGSGFTGATAVTFGGVAAQSFSVTNATSVTAVSPAGSGTVDVQVTTPVGTSVARTLDHFTYTGAASPPTVSSVSPSSGSTAGGTSVTIAGTNFTGATAVKFGAASASFTVNSATSITAMSPAGSAGVVDVTVTTSAGASAASAADQFTYQASPPTVTAVSPTSGSTAGGAIVTITGTNLAAPTSVMFGSASATFTVNSATSITATSPAGSAGTVNVTVTTSFGTSATSVADRFTYSAAIPTVNGITPASGPTAGGTSITITGSGFTGATAVKFGANSATTFTVNSATQIVATSPVGSAGVVDVTVTTAGGTSGTSAADQFTYTASQSAPTVTSISPSSGSIDSGPQVTITGTNFTDATAVNFGSTSTTAFTVSSATTILVWAPGGTPGTVDVTVTTPVGTSATGAADRYTFLEPAPAIVQISPTTGPTTGGASVTISGSDFSFATSVKFGNAAATFSIISPFSIVATSPVGSVGTVDIVVTTPGGTSATSSADKFTYTQGSPPTLTSISPASGTVDGGTSVTILGTNLTGASGVKFGSTVASFVVDSPTQITATSPAEPAGTVDVTVTTSLGTTAASAADKYTYGQTASTPPEVIAISPAIGPTAGGNSVIITGENLTGATNVQFGGTPASFTVTSPTSINATVPSGVGVVHVSVTTAAGSSALNTGDQYTYQDLPSVYSLSPPGGPTAGGNSVGIIASSFTGLTSVTFGGKNVPFTIASGSQINVIAPPGSVGSVDVVLTTAAGVSPITASDKYAYYDPAAKPTVTGVSPSAGAANAQVTITGTGFVTATGVTFGGVPVTSLIAPASDNSITVFAPTLPVGGAVDVQVINPNGTSPVSSADKFNFIAPPTITSVTPSSGSQEGGYQVVIAGTGFTTASQVRFGINSQSTTFTINSDTQITALVPFGVGTVDILVITSAGGTPQTASDKFTYVNFTPPVIASVSPSTGPTNGGNSVIITGSSFTGASTVQFGTMRTTFTVNSDTQITAVAPPNAPGAVDVVIDGPGGLSATSAADKYTYPGAAPVVTTVSPAGGPTTGGASVDILGANFTGATAVTFGTVAASAFSAVNDNEITATAPAGSGAVDVTVTTAQGKSATSASDQFAYAAAPSVSQVSPGTGPAAGGSSVTIAGSNFTGAAAVAFGATPATSFIVNSATSITATAPAGVGTVDVVVTAFGGSSAKVSADQFVYSGSLPGPTVSSISPNTGAVGAGTTVTITGANFTGATSVKFGASPATSFAVTSATSIEAAAPTGATGTVDVVVTSPNGTSPTASSDQFTYTAAAGAPTIDGVSPNSGSITGGTVVTITGTNFTGATNVEFAGAMATFSVNSATSITAVVPLGATAGVVDITVVTPGGVSATSGSDRFTYVIGAPTVGEVTPGTGATAGGTSVGVIGTNFYNVTAVMFGSKAATSFNIDTPKVIEAVAPAGSGTVDVTIVTSSGTSVTSSADRYTYTDTSQPIPTVTSISPTSGPANTTVTIVGTHLSNAFGVQFGGTSANATFISDNEIITSAPTGSGTVDVTVQNAAGISAKIAADQFTYTTVTTGPPVVNGLSPTAGTTGGGSSIEIFGSHFTGATSVKVGISPAKIFSVLNDNVISLTTPPGEPGAVDIIVTNSQGTSTANPGDQFTYSGPSPVPAITSVTPNSGLTNGGGTLLIAGSGFTNASSVKFGTVSATFTVFSDTGMNVTVPAGAPGLVNIVVTGPLGASLTTAADQYTYVAPAGAPSISGVSPSSGSSSGGTSVTISGAHFSGATSVKFGTASVGFSVSNDNTIFLVTAPTTAQVVDVTVSGPGGTSALTAADKYAFTPSSVPPSITNVSPTVGPLAGGNSIGINGANLMDVTSVKFGGVSAAFTLNSGNGLTAVAPPGSAGTVDIVVIAPAGSSAVSAADHYTYANPPAAPTITGLAPTSGSTAGGNSVVITGTNLSTAVAVRFGSVGANYTVNSDTQITAVAPSGSVGTIDIVVTNVTAASATNASDKYSYVSTVPTVTAVSPNSGSVTGGASVILTGTNFTGATAVKFGSASVSTFTVVSATQITVASPATSTAGAVDITVVTPNGVSATSTADQFTYQAPPTPTVTGVTPNSGASQGDEFVTVAGTNFIDVTAVKVNGQSTAFKVISPTTLTLNFYGGPAGTTADITVTTPGGTSATSTADQYTFVAAAAPAISSISPSSGPTAGGTLVVVNGTGFTNVISVRFGNQTVTSIPSLYDNQMQVLAPAGVAPGTVDIIVTTNIGASSPSAGDKFTYAAGPVVQSLSPNSGSTSGGNSVVITGSGFTGASAVRFGAAAAASYIVNSDAQITAMAPAGAAGFVDVTVTTVVGTSATGTFDRYTYGGSGTAPAITAVNPAGGPSSGGTTVTISGSGFTGATGVKFGAMAATAFAVNSDSQITATSPAGAAGGVDISVITANGTSAVSSADRFTYAASAAPTVTGVSPTSGSTAGGTSVTITGANFTGATGVKFGAAPATTFTVVSATSVTATSPAGSAGTVDVTVTTSAGTSVTSTSDHFTYTASQSAPAVTAITPTGGSTAGGTSVTITGTNFTGATGVMFGATAAATFTVNSATSITATSPAGSGVVDITVTTSGGTSATLAADQFTYSSGGGSPPVVNGVSPVGGPAAGGTTVTVLGSNFTGATLVAFGATPAASFTVVSATRITAVSPAGTGTVDILVTTPAGTSTARVIDHFTFRAGAALKADGASPDTGAPTVTAVSPNTGAATGGYWITLTGTNFTGATAVTFGSAPAGNFVVESATSIMAVTPSGTGTVDMRVTTPNGTSAVRASDHFTYQGTPSEPTITGLTPNSGLGTGGNTVVMTGTNFTGATAVKFGAASASFTVQSGTQLTAVAPAGAVGSVNVTVTNPSGTSGTGEAVYQYLPPAPTISAISPSTMVSGVQGQLVITGTNFTNVTDITIGGVSVGGTVSSTTIQTNVPMLAPGVYDVTITTFSGTSAITSADKLTITGVTAPKVTAISPTSGSTDGGTSVTITGSGFLSATGVKFGGAPAAFFNVNSDTTIVAGAPAGAAGAVDVTVADSAGVSVTSSADVFTYTPATLPTVASLSPTTGSTIGGTSVTIFGTNLSAVTAVKFGAVNASFTAPGANSIVATAPAGSAGVVDVTVVNPSGVSAATAADRFTYTAQPGPSVTGIGGNKQPTAGGGQVTISGAGFTAATSVKFGTTAATSFTVNSDSQITAIAPANPAGAVNVTVTTPLGTSAVNSSDVVTYVTPAVVNSLSPTSGGGGGGTTVTIIGSGFTAASDVYFGNDLAKSFKVVSDTKITAVTPAGYGAEGVRVANPVSMSNANVVFTYTSKPPAPSINLISPSSGTSLGGTMVSIEGANFFGVTSVTFGGVAATSFSVEDDEFIHAIAPAGSGTVDIRVVTAGGTTPVSSKDKYAYTAPAAPSITAVTPNNGPTAGGMSVTIAGSGFMGATTVNFGSVAAASFVVNNDNQITAVTPAETGSLTLPFGQVSVTVTTPQGTSFGDSASIYTFVAPVPAITAISPSNGPSTGGTNVTLTGTGFIGASGVKFGATAAASFTVKSDTQITVTSPAGVAGAVDVTVTTPGGTSSAVVGDRFTYAATQAAPAVTAISPSSGSTAGGTSVTITGSGFTGATGVKFGAAASTTFTVKSDTQIVATSPASSAGAVDVTVTTGGGVSATISTDRYTYTATVSAPAITAISPTSGPTAGGTSVTITGTNLSGATGVKFGATAAAAFTVNSATSITAASPAGSGVVDVTVTTSAGTTAAVTGDHFTYTTGGGGSAPVVNGVSPVGGPAAGGTTVTLLGSNFTGATLVAFGATPAASFTVVSATRITAVSPAGTGTVDILVTTPAGTSTARAIDHFTFRTGAALKAQVAIRVRTGANTSVSVALTRTVQAGGGKVTMLTPSNAGSATIEPDADGKSVSLAFKPTPGFFGKAVVHYTLSTAAASDDLVAEGDVEITVDTRPDPSADGGVRGVIQAETEASVRFADAQISNFNQHLESLHADGRGKGGNGVNFNFGFGQDQPNLMLQRDHDALRIDGDEAWPTPALGPDPQAKRPAPSKYPARAAAGPGLGNGSADSAITMWTGGAISFGQSDATTQRPGFRFTTDGLSAGVDARLSGQLTLGAGAGVGQSYAQVNGGSRVDGHDFVGVVYGDWRPVKRAYIDAIAGYGRLDFTSHRAVSGGGVAQGDRSGEDPFLSVTAGWMIERDGGFKLTPYVRLDEISGRLDAFTEHGASTADLRYDAQSFDSLQGTLGLRGEWRVPTSYGDWMPRFRFEAHHQFDGTGLAGVNYADDLAGPPFTTQADPMRSDSLSAGVGADLHWQNKTLNLDYTFTSDLVRETVHDLHAKLAFKFW